MASKVSATRGVRTRFRNVMETEMGNGQTLLQARWEPGETNLEVLVLKATKCSEKIKLYVEKLETQSEKLMSCMEDADVDDVDAILNEDCTLCSNAMDICLDLKGFKDKLVSREREVKPSFVAEDPNTKEIVQLQKDMQALMASQLRQQEIATKKENEHTSSVKLPKIEIPSFNGEKTKWFEFWDSFKSSVHNNKRISDVEKFNYLKSKLRGEAENAISGLSLTNENYMLAVDIMEKRFGNTQEIIDLHYNKLVNLQPALNRVCSLRSFLDTVEKHVRSLEVLKQDMNQDVFVSIIRSKLPEDVLLQLEIQHGVNKRWTLKSLGNELREYVVARERATNANMCTNDRPHIQASGPKRSPVVRNITHTKSSSSVQAFTTGASSQKDKRGAKPTDKKCRYCSHPHWSDECEKYKAISERKNCIKGSCHKCLKPGHAFKECKTKRACVYCGEMNVHHRSLCPKKFNFKPTIAHMANETEVTEDITQESGLMSVDEMVLMQTALTTVSSPNSQRSESVRILLDSGSQRSYITESIAQKLSLPYEGVENIHLVTSGSRTSKSIKTKYSKVDVKLKNGNNKQITVNVVPVISGELHRKPVCDISTNNIAEILNSVELADTVLATQETTQIDILLGNDYYLDFIHGEKIELNPGLYLLASSLGWILSGRTCDVEEPTDNSSMIMLSHGSSMAKSQFVVRADSSLPIKPDIEDFWNIESIGIVDECNQSDDAIAMDKFKETLKFENGRYQMTWPWIQENPDLPNNKELSLGRLKSTVNRLKKKPDMLQKYDKVIVDQLEKGIIEEVDKSEPDGLVHYIPHHAVITPQKTTTKLRVVYDASAKTRKEHKSLNECLYRGPVMLNDLCGLLMRFRIHHVAIAADIEKAFLQLGLQNDQRDVTRFVWLKDITNLSTDTKNVQEYRFTRVLFGVVSSPFLLGATIEAHLDAQKSEIADKMKKDIYVDNLITGANSVFEAKKLYTSAKDLFNRGAMNLREWMSNSVEVSESFAPEDRSDEKSSNILGHSWDLQRDTLSLKPTSINFDDKTLTKRLVLKRLASVFDPLGLFSPVLLRGKLFLQQLWSKRFKWDDPLSDNDLQRWSEIESDLNKVSSVKIARCVSDKISNVIMLL